MPHIAPGLRPFCECGYQILDADFARDRELSILSVDPLTPRVGDLFTVDSRGVVHELSVVRTATFQGGWSAVCRVTDVF